MKLPSSECASCYLVPALVRHTQCRNQKMRREALATKTSWPECSHWVSARRGENDLKLSIQKSKHTVHKGDICKESPDIINHNGDQPAVAGVAQWIEHQPANLNVASSIPSQGTCLGCLIGDVREATNRCFSGTSMFLSLSFFLSSPLSKNT